MRCCLIRACVALALASTTPGQQVVREGKIGEHRQAHSESTGLALKDTLEANIRAAWAAFKNKNKGDYAEFLADDFVAVEADNEGERNKWHVLREVESSMITDFTLSFFKVTALGPDAALVRYEAFFHFPPRSAVRFEKVYIGEVWVRRNGQWKALHYQETRVK